MNPDYAELAMRLADVDPWSHSTEGLDDCCIFCDSMTTGGMDGGLFVQVHNDDCVWIEARTLLGMGFDTGYSRHTTTRSH